MIQQNYGETSIANVVWLQHVKFDCKHAKKIKLNSKIKNNRNDYT